MLKTVRMTTDKWKGLEVGQVIRYQGQPYVIVAMGIGEPRYWNGSLTVDLVIQGPDEIPNQIEEQYTTSTKYMHADKIKISVGEFGTMSDGILVRILGIERFKWVLTDLAINYIVQTVPGWTPMEINKIIRNWQKENTQIPVIDDGKVVRFDFRKVK